LLEAIAQGAKRESPKRVSFRASRFWEDRCCWPLGHKPEKAVNMRVLAIGITGVTAALLAGILAMECPGYDAD
jgi:hypothetical protein